MKLKSFKSTASYQIVDNLYNSQKEFIILGLCGKVGSGVSEVSNILQNKFEDLHLPKPGNELLQKDSYAEHEYRILYNYAEKNWAKFYKIRTSALITRRILTKKLEECLVSIGIIFGGLNFLLCGNVRADSMI